MHIGYINSVLLQIFMKEKRLQQNHIEWSRLAVNKK